MNVYVLKKKIKIKKIKENHSSVKGWVCSAVCDPSPDQELGTGSVCLQLQQGLRVGLGLQMPGDAQKI